MHKDVNYDNSVAVLAKALYFASVLDRAIICCLRQL
jgi:hypothetical protein